MNKLFMVNVNLDMVVAAEDEQDAIRVGEIWVEDELGNAIMNATEVTNESQLAGWDDEYPLGIDTDLTCLEILRGSRQQRINEAQAAITGFLFNPYNNESQSPSKAGGIFDAVP